MAGAHWRRAVSEGSLFPTVMCNLRTEQSRRGGKGRGERERADKGSGGGSRRFARGKRVICRRDLEEEGGVTSGHVGKSTVEIIQTVKHSKLNQIRIEYIVS